MSKRQWGNGFYRGYETAIKEITSLDVKNEVKGYIDQYCAHYYHVYPIDGNWFRFRSVRETLADEQVYDKNSYNYLDHASVNYVFGHAREAAKNIANIDDDDNRWVMFWVPCEGHFSYGFAVPGDGGHAFICSPVKLPHLEKVSYWIGEESLPYRVSTF